MPRLQQIFFLRQTDVSASSLQAHRGSVGQMAAHDVEAAQQPLLNDDDPEARTASRLCGKQT